MNDTLIEDSAARLFGDHVDNAVRERAEAGLMDATLWQRVVDSGFTQVLASAAGGGIGETWQAAFPLLHGLGYWQVPLPLAETMTGVLLLSLAGLAVPEEPIGLIEQGEGNDLRTGTVGTAVRLHGTAHRVAWARAAGSVLVSLADGRLLWVDLHTAHGVTIVPRADLAGLPSDSIIFDGTDVAAERPCPLPLAQPVWTLGALARSVMMAGALDWVLEQSVRYAGERVQFGKPIAAHQAIQQQLAVLAGDVAAARMSAQMAAADGPSDGTRDSFHTPFSTAVAKIRCGEAATRATAIAHQVHGAMGFTREHPLHFATRRLWAWRDEFGSEAWWAARLGRAVIAGGASAFWPALTERRFDLPAHAAPPGSTA